MMFLRIIAAIAFAALVAIGCVAWIGSSDRLQSSVGFSAFLTGLIGLLLVDIAMNLGTLVRYREEDKAKAVVAMRTQARSRYNGEITNDKNDWQNQNVEIDDKCAEWVSAAGKK